MASPRVVGQRACVPRGAPMGHVAICSSWETAKIKNCFPSGHGANRGLRGSRSQGQAAGLHTALGSHPMPSLRV
jgi:hypothetical protein